MRRVVITGIGVVSSIGTGAAAFARALREGRSGARPIGAFDTTGFAHATGCEVVGFEPERWVRNVPLDEVGRAARFAIASARMALDDAALTEEELRRRPGLVSIGTTDGGSDDGERLAASYVHSGPESMDPVAARRLPASTLATGVARELGLSDVDVSTIATACAAGNYAIGNGFDAVRTGEADFALCGGADAMCRMTFTGFYRLGAVDPDGCRPFDVNRRGILTGEGGAVLLLEPLESALERGARVYAEILGYGLNCDAHHQVAPDGDSVRRCMELALADAGVGPGEVDLISAHGTGTKANDVTECGAIRGAFGDRPPRTVSVKSMLGHTMGAASALGAAACALGIEHGFIPPTINHTEKDPDCGIDCVPNTAVEAELRVVQNNALAFGGNNAVVVLGKR
ncbi:beta-ketoacyl-[acyl-carrier-protein] synthase family protein [Prauserella endophytica]|uniref:3-oxoacyl-[acyl-carrier-protein] synthase 1 n=1 Tax=Prauserella endophytica TaxID=1592324 RepID=A0ABY2S2F4_9PSEU|nr:beta-ketoacyl-[acyl-carrier-protein] synthase family protein [Prauserella endophytica]PXY17201.1 3-oxoacyl-ACP synthase [Prauserella coralliicola]TKG67644.1 beta-ketoacyl-[acyl-carrier-protein] synthase family protein [Prauserella endophytica]